MENRLSVRILKPFFVTFLVAAMVGLAIDGVFTWYILPELLPSTNVKKIDRLINETHEEEIPIFGSSIARRNYFPDSLGTDYYNYGMAGALFTSIEPLIKIELDKNKRTPILIDYDHHTFFYDHSSRIQVSNYVPFLSNKHIKNLLVETDRYSWHYEVPGMRYYGSYLDYIRDFMKPAFEREEITNRGGVYFPYKPKVYEQFRNKRLQMIEKLHQYKTRKRIESDVFTLREEREMEFLDMMLNFHPDNDLLERFEKLVTNTDRLFLLVYPPQNIIKLQGLENYEDVIAQLRYLADEHTNIAVINMSGIDFDESLFKDSGHMNIDGARKFSSLLRPYLNEAISNPVKNSYVEVR